jgi:peptide chain release factor 3
MNKLDREGQEAFALLDELEREFGIHARPLSWPIGMGRNFQGVYNIYKQQLALYSPSKTELSDEIVLIAEDDHASLEKHIGAAAAAKLREELDLINAMYEPFDQEHYRDGYLAPVFFGSALNNFGVKDLLDTFVEVAPRPLPRETTTRSVAPEEDAFTGFVFKIHANLDPNHRARIAFCRVCSGRFERGKFYLHTRLGKQLRFTSPTSFMANERNIVDDAWPGDVVGLHDTGSFKIGDTLTEGEDLAYKGIPSFSPEIFKLVVNRDPFKSKQLEKGIRQLTDEGVAQLFVREHGNEKIVGTVGELQYEVILFRLREEYGATADFRLLNVYKAFWFTCDDKKELDRFVKLQQRHIALDKDGNPVYLPEGNWAFNAAREMFKTIDFHTTSEFGK